MALNAREEHLIRRWIVRAGLLATIAMGSAAAHHSPVAFDLKVTDFAIRGEVTAVDVRNPHSVMDVRVANEDGSTTLWHVEFSSVNLLLRRGWDLERLKVGERVTCIGNPSALGKPEMYMWSVVLADGTEFAR